MTYLIDGPVWPVDDAVRLNWHLQVASLRELTLETTNGAAMEKTFRQLAADLNTGRHYGDDTVLSSRDSRPLSDKQPGFYGNMATRTGTRSCRTQKRAIIWMISVSPIYCDNVDMLTHLYRPKLCAPGPCNYYCTSRRCYCCCCLLCCVRQIS